MKLFKNQKELKELTLKAALAKIECLEKENGFEEYFFTKSILEMSIITVIVT